MKPLSLLLSIFLLFFKSVYSEEPEYKNITDSMVTIPAGKFKMGCNQFGPMHGAPEHFVYVDDFWIDRFEITNNKYEEIIPDHKLRRSKLSHCDECPVTNISWYAAIDYCYLIGKTLPSEAQWEKAAGSGDGCSFTWGYGFDSDKKKGRGGLQMSDKSISVGSYPPNDYGIYDMSGNVWEWVLDWMAPYPESELLINPIGPSKGIMKVRRGGAYSDDVKAMTTGYRDWSHPSSRFFSDIGFRCALNIKGKSPDGISAQD